MQTPMDDSFARQVWSELFSDGTPFEILSFLWFRVTDNALLSAFLLMLWTFTLRLALVSFYFSLLYFIVAYIKKRLHKKLSVRANYYSWYLLLFSVVLANLWFNNGFIALPAKLVYESYEHSHINQPDAPFGICLFLFSAIWLMVFIFKLASLARMNQRIKTSMKHMERYDDMEGLAEKAAATLGLRKMPDIWVADYIQTPVSCGVFKKVILLPVDYEEKYTAGELYLLLLHEMTHIRHGDTVKLFIMNLVECFLWLTPAVRLFTKSFKRDAELLCDNRVIGLQESARDTYGNLILKECSYKTARFGFGFSDSYHAIENRLDALYRYKADGRLKLLAIIPAALLLICALSLAFRAEWFEVNPQYSSDFEIRVFDESTGNYVPLPPEVCDGLYVIEDDGIDHLSLRFIDDAVREVAGQYAVDGMISIKAVSDSYAIHTGESDLTYGLNHGDDIEAVKPEIPDDPEFLIIYSAIPLRTRTFAEYVLLWITSKL